jgi:peptidyl-prolyl cis-trans isomerase SurA
MRNIIIIITLFLILLTINVKSKENIFIVYKIKNEIITNIDIEKEKSYLSALNNSLKSLDNIKLTSIAKESLVRELIKKIELEKFYTLDQSNPMLDVVLKDLFERIGFKSKEEFQTYLAQYNLHINEIKKKLEIENTWNQMIYSIFKDGIFIDEKKIHKKVSEMNVVNKSYLLSEIVFKNEKKNLQNKKIKEIQNSINEIGFENSANIFSISRSKNFGGKIGWVEEKLLSKKLIKNIKKIKIGEVTPPIDAGANSIILKINDYKIEELQIDKKKEFEKLFVFETNKQLEKLSMVHFSRIKLNTSINAL